LQFKSIAENKKDSLACDRAGLQNDIFFLLLQTLIPDFSRQTVHENFCL